MGFTAKNHKVRAQEKQDKTNNTLCTNYNSLLDVKTHSIFDKLNSKIGEVRETINDVLYDLRILEYDIRRMRNGN